MTHITDGEGSGAAPTVSLDDGASTEYDVEQDVIDPKNCSVHSAMSYYQTSAHKGVIGEKLVPSALHSFESMTTQGQQHPHRRITELPQQSPEKPALIIDQPEASIISSWTNGKARQFPREPIASAEPYTR